MLRIVLFSICVTSFFCCPIQAQDCTLRYKVTNIDSTKANYLIYLKRGKQKSLVISPKKVKGTRQGFSNQNKIVAGKRYKLKLSKFQVEYASIPPEMEHSVSIDEKVVWKSEDNFGLVVTKNLTGLYYSFNNEEP